MQRTRIQDRVLPHYTPGEEWMNTVTHGIGILMGIAVLILCARKSVTALSCTGSIIYGLCMIAVYTVSTVYHGSRPGNTKKALQVLDHCTIYLLIAGTYTPILLSTFVQKNPVLGWGLLIFQWSSAIVSIILNAIDLKRFRVISYTAYIVMGWAIIFVAPVAIHLIGRDGFLWLLSGGISYTVGAVLYAIGSKKPWFHSAFHIFVLLGSLLQFLSIYWFML